MKTFAGILFISILSFSVFAQQTAKTKAADATSNYDIQDSISIKTRDGGSISAMLVRSKTDKKAKPVLFQFTIYVRDNGRDLASLKEAVDSGYIGVIAYTRGKRFSPNEILPYENDGNDAYDVIDWISKQQWCNGSVGMYGGSYNGFTQWAACKKVHPALKTIIPYVANRPGMGLPMENNVFINPNYEWSFYVGNTKYLDTLVGNDRKRFRKMQFRWWEIGSAYHTLDSIDGTPNKLFQRWIRHPDFDDYWQKMAPYKEEFAQINIPVLAIDGYYNDSQNSSIYYLKELEKYNPKANYYLIIGPYSHFGAQREGQAIINGYKVDANALINTKEITYAWFNYILKNGKKPKQLKDRINYQVMDANEWRSAPSFDKMHNDYLHLYLTTQKEGNYYSLASKKPNNNNFLYQEVDFADRKISNNDYYPDPIIRKEIDTSNGFNFISEPLQEAVLINGSFVGELKASINKLDMDIGVTLYELKPDGSYFHLAYFIGRASYSKDITKRNLLQPNTIETIPFSNTHVVSKYLQKGSRLVIHLNVNKNPFSELNYGTGKLVREENIQDAKEVLKVKWFEGGWVKVPVRRL